MAVKDRATLLSDIATLLADNVIGAISELDVRTVTGDSADSNFNITDDDTDDITEGTTNLFFSSAEQSKLTGIAAGAEVNLDWQTQLYTAGVDYTAGVTTNLTMPVAAPSDDEDHVRVSFEALNQLSDQWSISGTTITFTSPIPAGVDKVEIQVLA